MLTLKNNDGVEYRIENTRTDNVVVIKQKLNRQIYKREVNIVLYDGYDKLDNNLFIPDGKTVFKYEELNEQSSDIIVKVKPNKLMIPELLQVNKFEKFNELKQKIKEWFKIKDDIVIYLDDCEPKEFETLEDNNFVDECEIEICKTADRMLELSVTSILANLETIGLSCFIWESVSKLKEKICKEFKLEVGAEIGLFSQTDCLEKDKKLIDYNIQNKDLIFFVNLDKSDNFKIGEPLNSKKPGKFAEILEGEIISSNKKIVLKKYDLNKKLLDFKPLKYEIIAFLNLRLDGDPKRFVELVAMFEKDSNFYIGMELMENGSLENRIPLNEEDVIKYGKEILEALDYFHKRKIIYRNMRCSSVLLDNEDHVKICNLHMSKYLIDCDHEVLMKGLLGSKPVDYNWAAPETLAGNKYGIPADIWSFGATLIEMVTGDPPYKNIKSSGAVKKKILRTKTIEYDSSSISETLKEVIKLCLSSDPLERPTADKLLEKFRSMRF